jgi:hypothetical protein
MWQGVCLGSPIQFTVHGSQSPGAFLLAPCRYNRGRVPLQAELIFPMALVPLEYNQEISQHLSRNEGPTVHSFPACGPGVRPRREKQGRPGGRYL